MGPRDSSSDTDRSALWESAGSPIPGTAFLSLSQRGPRVPDAGALPPPLGMQTLLPPGSSACRLHCLLGSQGPLPSPPARTPSRLPSRLDLPWGPTLTFAVAWQAQPVLAGGLDTGVGSVSVTQGPPGPKEALRQVPPGPYVPYLVPGSTGEGAFPRG